MGGSAAEASRTAQVWGKTLRSELLRLQDQAGSPANQRFDVTDLAVGQTPSAGKSGLRKVQAILVGLGLVLGAGLALLLEGAYRARADRAARRRSLAGLDPLHPDDDGYGTGLPPDDAAPGQPLARRSPAGSWH